MEQDENRLRKNVQARINGIIKLVVYRWFRAGCINRTRIRQQFLVTLWRIMRIRFYYQKKLKFSKCLLMTSMFYQIKKYNMLKTQKFKILYISQLILQKQNLVTIAEQINKHNKQSQYYIIPKSVSNNSEQNLIIALLTQLNTTNISQNNISAKWFLCQESQLAQINQHFDGRIIVGQGKKLNYLKNNKIFGAKTFIQALGIVYMSQKQLNIRLKMQRFLNASKTKYEYNQYIYKFRQIATTLSQHYTCIVLKNLTKALYFYGKLRLKKLRKYFIQWTISHYEKIIQKQQKQLVDGFYLLQRSNKKLIDKCFNVWKCLRKQKLLYKKY